MADFIKVGNIVRLKSQGLDYSLETGRCYNLKWNNYEDYSYLECDGELKLPKKIYGDTSTKDRILKSFSGTDKSMGVLLKGLKGSGKTLLSKILAKESNLPIIIVQDDYPVARATEFFNRIEQPVVILFDEVEKNTCYWATDKLLKLLDGVQTGGKKLTIMTCNDITHLDDNLKDRCGRIRYCIEYNGLNADAIQDIVKDLLGEDHADEVSKNIFESVKTLSYDNIISICDEIKLFPELGFNDIISILNIETK